jgi:hypothetical protein
MAMRPVVDGIERQYADRLRVVRVNIQEPAGAQLSREWDVMFTPTFLLFDERGAEKLRRVGRLTPDDLSPFLGP